MSAPAPALPRLVDKIALWPTGRLQAYGKNPRTHSNEQVGQLVESIRRFGFVNPILIDAEGQVVAGHGRLLAAQHLGLVEVPVVILDHLNPIERRAYVIADNKLAMNAGWDEALLAHELEALKLEEFDLDLLGFNDDELAALLGEPAGDAENSDGFAPSEPSEQPVSQIGDLWHLDQHLVLCGDATDANAMTRLMQGAEARMAFTDPPYNVAYEGSASDRDLGISRPIANDDLGDDFPAFLERACRQILRVTSGGVYICMSSQELDSLQGAFRRAGGHWSTFIIWAKNAFSLGRSDYHRQYEPILYGWRQGSSRFWCGDRNQSDLWPIDRPVANDLHPTMKPVELIERAILNSSEPYDLVLDPFGGSGSTLIACESQQRYARLIELDPRYVDVTINRWEEITGDRARLDGSGLTFGETRIERKAG